MPANIYRSDPTASEHFLRTWGNPEQQYALSQDDRAYRYLRLWDLYQGTAFDDLKAWAKYRRQFGLYRATRQIWDHTFQLVEFYATHIWSGSLAADGLTLPDGVENAVPLAPDTNPDLAAAIAQLWLWWNFQEQMTTIVRYTAALGELLVELVDDTERGKVLIRLYWPGYVKDVQLDHSGNIESYTIEYTVRDEVTGDSYVYKRQVDKEAIRTYRDGDPFDYAQQPTIDTDEPYGEAVAGGFGDEPPGFFETPGYEIENPYGFAPAVWFRHITTQGVRGEPAIWSTQAQLDEANELLSHLIDKGHVSLEAPIVVSGNLAPNALQQALNKMTQTVKRTFSELSQERPVRERESVNVLEGPAGTKVETIELKITEALAAVKEIIASIEKKCPEIVFYQQLRSMTQLTGPSVQPLMGDVDKKFRSVGGGYDRNLIRLLQMGISMAAMRYREAAEGWQNPDEAQSKFANFDEGSFDRGDLAFDIMPRSVVRITQKDKLDLLQQKKNIFGDFIPPEELAAELGYPPEKIAQWKREAEKRQREQQQQMLRQTQPLNQNGRTPRPPGAPPGGPQRGQAVQNRRNRNSEGVVTQ